MFLELHDTPEVKMTLTGWFLELQHFFLRFAVEADDFANEFKEFKTPDYGAGSGDVGMTWLLIGVAVAFAGFAIYRLIDLMQLRHVKNATKPDDLDLSQEVFDIKRKRKSKRGWQTFFKTSVTWGAQLAYVVGVMPLAVIMLQDKLGQQYLYYVLVGGSYILNILLSRTFSLWNPSLPFTPALPSRGHGHGRGKIGTYMLWHAWGLFMWSAPTYFFVAYGAKGWMGSVAFIWIGQIIQLVVFIFTIKKKAIPYQQYEGLSAGFKSSLQKYLATQGMRDDEVGVVTGMKVGPNAFATGLFGYRQIVLTEELIKGFADPSNPGFQFKLSDDALEAVVAHEVGHIKGKHVMISIGVGALISSLTTIAVYMIFTAKALSPDYFMFDNSTSTQIYAYYGQSFFNLLLMYPLQFIMISLIRRNEFNADTHLLDTNGCKKGWEFFYQIRHIAPVNNHPLWDRCNATHPAPHLREKRIRDWEGQHCKPE